MSQTLTVFRLQQTDSRIDAINKRLGEIRQTLENDRELVKARTKAEKTESELKTAERTLAECEANVESQRLKIEQSESSLYGGSVKNPKELQDLQNEVASLKRFLVTLEDRLLEAMLYQEEAEKKHQTSLKELNDVRSKLATQNSSLTAEQDLLTQEGERMHAERQAIAPSLDANALAHYEELRQEKRGLAVAEISDKTCAACGTTLTPAQQQAARFELTYCPTCGRILYAS